MSDQIVWLVDLDGWMAGIVFARGISPEELAVRMGADPGAAWPPSRSRTPRWGGSGSRSTEVWRGGEEPDLPLPGLVAAGALSPDGRTCLPPEDENCRTGCRRRLGAVVWRFGPSLSPAFLKDARVPACAVRGAQRMPLSR